MGEGVGGGVELAEVGGLIEVAAVLEAQAEVGDEAPVEAGAIDVDGFGEVVVATWRAVRNVEQYPGPEDAEGTEIGDVDGGDPVGGDFVGVGGNGDGERTARDNADRAGVGASDGVSLVGAVEGVGGFKAEDGVGGVAELKETARLVGRALLGAVAVGGAAEGAVGAEGDAGLGGGDVGGEGDEKRSGQKEGWMKSRAIRMKTASILR